jgi:hypothetical protein
MLMGWHCDLSTAKTSSCMVFDHNQLGTNHGVHISACSAGHPRPNPVCVRHIDTLLPPTLVIPVYQSGLEEVEKGRWGP